MRPFNDKIKVRIRKDEFGFGEASIKKECGVVVEVPTEMIYFGLHSYCFDGSLGNEEVLGRVLKHYKALEGKLVVWEALKDSGRHFKEGDEEFVLLNMTDVIAYSDDVDAQIETVDQVGGAGSFNLS